ncbi:MAG: glycosyltransferase family 4 protein [Actinomycetota bacterium]|nr:glycosyltransferase family 4 protein [Actinomycetota bacterium]
MRILACVHEAPAHPLNGFGLQLIEVFDRLASRHDVRVVTYEPPPGRALERDYLSLVARRRLGVRSSLRRAGGAAAGLRDPLRAALRERRPDVVHVSSGRIARLGRELDGAPSVLAALDAWHLNVAAKAAVASGPRRVLLALEERRVRSFIATEYRRFDGVSVVTPEDADALKEVDPALRPVVIPNGVDAEAYAPDGSVAPEPAAVVFSGAMDYAPNEAAAAFLAEAVMPAVWESVPRARLYLVGRNPSDRVAPLARDERVTVTGEVDAMGPWLNRAAVYACPMVSGTGIKNKLLEALACAAPAVCTPLACRGLSAVPGEHLAVANDAASLAAAIVRLLSDRDEARALGDAGRRYVLENHSWGATARAYERLYEEIADRRGT